ncbi:MAG: tetratricopeptide repeat protein, partial [Bryobacteraceae bacterium]
QAFANIDRLLAEGIERWTAALKLQPNDFSAHHELARSALDRGDARLAAEHFEQAWRLRSDLPSVLVELGRAWTEIGEGERAMAAFLAASRGTEPRAAQEARALLPVRSPGDRELRNAIGLDPKNAELRRELAHLLAAAGKTEEAAAEAAMLPKPSPASAPSVDPKEMGQRSYEKGYLPDALKYYSMANEADPLDFEVLLKLGWTNNLLRRDREAARWFALAKKSPDPGISREASRAEKQIRPSAARFRTSAWFFPSYSSRWRDMFTYGQAKVEMRLGSLPLRTYLSTRFIGDTRTAASSNLPQYLSESSFIFGAGIATDYWRGFTLWGEAGSAVNYLSNRRDLPRAAPDYRGGVAFHRGFGRLLGSATSGAFYETNADGVFISRFQNDFVLYDQNRFGLTLPAVEPLGGLQTQLYWNANASADARSQSWANTVETGPGLRLRWKAMPPGWLFSADFVRGAYTRNEGNSQRPNYFDLRIGVWYSLTR